LVLQNNNTIFVI